MPHLYKCLLVALIVPFYSVAQSNYKPGFVITLKNDTLHGVIDYKEWDRNPKEIRFKNSLTPHNIEIFSKANTRAFEISGVEYYQCFTLPISQDQVENNKLSTHPDTTYLTDTVFLRVIATGKHITLYSYTDDIKTHFYFLEAGGTIPEELVYHIYYNPTLSNAVQYVNGYRSQLEDLASKYANVTQLEQRILQVGYNEPDLVKIINVINDNTSSKSLFGSRFFAGIGANSGKLSFTQISGTATGNNSVTYGTSVFPKLTAGIDLFPNKSIQRLLIRVELSLTTSQYNFVTVNSGTPQSTSSLNFKQTTSAIAPQILYNLYNAKQIKVFLGAGTALNFSSYNHYHYVTKYSGSFPDNIKDNYPALSSLWIAFPLRAGITINNRIEVSFCYIPSSSITTDNTTSVNATFFQAGLNYLFK
ncbi:MAG: hypothetical protein JWP44_2532 [Mucilaginibacter sp.]|nr:hypothetical protein [Mucilaginibacter sp.]